MLSATKSNPRKDRLRRNENRRPASKPHGQFAESEAASACLGKDVQDERGDGEKKNGPGEDHGVKKWN